MRPKDQDVADNRGSGPAGSDPAGAPDVTGVPGAAAGVCLAAITMPASEAYVSFARTATAHVGGALGLSVGRIADLRLAVDEACGQFLQGPPPVRGAAVPLQLRFDRRPETLRITVCGPVGSDWPDRESLSWLVLDALVAEVRCGTGPGDGVGMLTFVERLSSEAASDDALSFAAP